MELRQLTAAEITRVSGAGLNWCNQADVDACAKFGQQIFDMAAQIDGSKDPRYVASTHPLLKGLLTAWVNYYGGDGAASVANSAIQFAPK